MSVFSRIKSLFVSCTAQLAQPSEERPLFRLIRERQIRRIVEVGVGTGDRTVRMLQVALRNYSPADVLYTGIDLFEARTDRSQGMSLKEAHRKLKATQARISLVPGDPYTALARVANTLMGTELVLISADQAGESLDRAWYYVPRLLAPYAAVFRDAVDAQSGEVVSQLLSRLEVEALASRSRPRRMAA